MAGPARRRAYAWQRQVEQRPKSIARRRVRPRLRYEQLTMPVIRLADAGPEGLATTRTEPVIHDGGTRVGHGPAGPRPPAGRAAGESAGLTGSDFS